MSQWDPLSESNGPIVQVGDPVLRVRATEVASDQFGSAELAGVIARMRQALVEVPGVGLAAPQIGVSARIAIVQDLPEFLEVLTPEQVSERERSRIDQYVLINPVLSSVGADRRTFFEGCLSVKGYLGAVERDYQLHVEYVDENGSPRQEDVSGWHARILQHEVDHLDGTLYTDRMVRRTLCSEQAFRALYADLPAELAIGALEAPIRP